MLDIVSVYRRGKTNRSKMSGREHRSAFWGWRATLTEIPEMTTEVFVPMSANAVVRHSFLDV